MNLWSLLNVLWFDYFPRLCQGIGYDFCRSSSNRLSCLSADCLIQLKPNRLRRSVAGRPWTFLTDFYIYGYALPYLWDTLYFTGQDRIFFVDKFGEDSDMARFEMFENRYAGFSGFNETSRSQPIGQSH